MKIRIIAGWWKGHKNLKKKISNSCIVKIGWRYFQILWPSHNVLNLTNFFFSKVCWQHQAMFCLYTSSKLEFEFSRKVKGSNPGYLFFLKKKLYFTITWEKLRAYWPNIYTVPLYPVRHLHLPDFRHTPPFWHGGSQITRWDKKNVVIKSFYDSICLGKDIPLLT